MHRITFVVMSLMMLLVLASTAQAQAVGDGLDTERFKPSADSQGLILTEGGQGELAWDFNLGLYLHYSRQPLVINDADGNLLYSLVDNRMAADLYFSMGVTDWLTLAVDVPVFLYQSGETLGASNESLSLTSAGFGDIRVSPKFTLLRQSRFGVSLALSVPVTLPSGDESAYQGSDSVTVMPTVAASRTFFSDKLLVAANLGFWLKGNAEMKDLNAGHEMFYKAGAKYGFIEDWAASAELAGGARIESMGSNLPSETPMEVLAAVHYSAPLDMQVVLGGGVGALPGWGTPNFRAFLGLSWSPRIKDQDGDGVEDEQDRCRTEKGPAENDGCPWGDSDGDGLTDDQDACAKTAGPQENKGCPWGDADKDRVTDNVDKCPKQAGPTDNQGCPWGDADKDGLADNLDACPEQAGPEDNKGCPSQDSDGDGLMDYEDKCPNEAEDIDKFEDEDGCPDLDNDQDGIADGRDKCPNEAEVINGFEDEDGCPDKGKVVVVVKKDKIEIMKKVYFATSKATIQRESFSLLDQVAQTLRAHSELKKVRIEGHTDDSGPDSFNLKLSQQRAEAVRTYLVGKGVPAERLVAEGFGETKPIAPNKTRSGRSQNRRVEFVIVE
ncbi:MAG: OmpA family protein [Deltaproteobacteria bacterium]|nr:OmpA family protein [Deltaproteobacteria bacterium]